MTGSSNGGQSVIDAVFAGHVPAHSAKGFALETHLEHRAIGLDQLGLPAPLADHLDRGPAAHGHHFRQVHVILGMDDQAIAGHGTDHMVKLLLDGFDVFKDVGVIKFQVVADQGTRHVVDELGALVEKRGIVFVRLDHEKRVLAQAGGHVEILRHAADQVARLQPRLLQYPGHHGGGRGLAVGAGHANHPAPLQYVIAQPLGSAGIGQATVEHVLHRRIAPGHGVADDHQIRCRVQMGGVIAFQQLDALLLQLGAHGGIDVGVRSTHPVAQRLGQHCKTAHEGAADTEKMQMHEISLLGGRHQRCADGKQTEGQGQGQQIPLQPADIQGMGIDVTLDQHVPDVDEQ